MYSYTFSKTVNLDKLIVEIVTAGILVACVDISSPTDFTIKTLLQLTSPQITTLNGVVAAHSAIPTDQEVALAALSSSAAFGQVLIKAFQAENAVMGITASGKTRAVSNYLNNLSQYLRDGSLYGAIDELTAISNDLTLPLSGLSPYVTSARAKLYRGKIQTYLGIPVTP